MKMSKIELKFVSFVQNNLETIFAVIATVVGIFERYFPRQWISADADHYLLPWFSEISNNGGIYGLGKQVGDYNIAYQEAIAFMTHIPFDNALFLYKMFSALFDLGLAVAAGLLVYYISADNKKKRNGILAYAVVFCLPTVFLNSCAWAQCDSIYTFFCILCLLFFIRGKETAGLILFGCAFAFKLQAVFLLPFLLFFWFCTKKFSILSFIWVPITVFVIDIPAFLMGRSLTDIVSVYGGQVNGSGEIFCNYPSFWSIFTNVELDWLGKYLTGSAISLSLIVLVAFFIECLHRIETRLEMETFQWIQIAFISIYTVVIFMPSMHERYGFLYEILALILAVLDAKLIIPAIVLELMSLMTYGAFLVNTEINLQILGWINIGIYLFYIYHFFFISLKKHVKPKDCVKAE